jgi:peptide/nickel transport system permease protein
MAVRFRPYYTSSAWWISTVPGAAISCLVLSASLLGNWIRDVLDPLRRYRE